MGADVTHEADNVFAVRRGLQPGLEPQWALGEVQLVLAGLEPAGRPAAVKGFGEDRGDILRQQVFWARAGKSCRISVQVTRLAGAIADDATVRREQEKQIRQRCNQRLYGG